MQLLSHLSPFLIPPSVRTGVPSPRGKVFSQARQSFKFQFVVLLLYADSLNTSLPFNAAIVIKTASRSGGGLVNEQSGRILWG